MAPINTEAGKRGHVGLHKKDAQPTQTLGSQLAFASEEPWPPPKTSHKPWRLGRIPLLIPYKGFFRRKGAEQLRVAWELELGSCVHDSPTPTASLSSLVPSGDLSPLTRAS